VNFLGKTAIVTGGANGIGLAIAQALTASGASVFIFDLASEDPQAVAESFGARGCVADVTDRASLEAAFAQLPALDVAIVNAGTSHLASLAGTTPEIWRKILAVNLTGAFDTLQLASERMKPLRKGSIVITASTNSFDGEADLISYNATKAGLLGVLHTAANELGPYGIRVNAVCPGLIRTRLNEPSFSNPAVISEYFKHVALGRGGEPGEVAQAALFLASDLASYITGTTLVVDGGQLASKFGTWGQPADRFDGQAWCRGE
jgi:NAD(P)-dependent dehydrogenase (short-subunit alcohol dehydrogenase family)